MRHHLSSNAHLPLAITLALLLATTAPPARPQLIPCPGPAPPADVKGPIDLTIVPNFDDARVTVTVDGQKIVEGLRSPWHVPVDFGPMPVEHKIVVTAIGADRKRIQWQTTINKGHQTLGVKIEPVDVANRIFEANVTSPDEDPIVAVSAWDDGKPIATAEEAPYRFTIPAEHFAQKTVQITARTKSGAEAADFWSATGDVKAEGIEVRTVPLFVSVIDRNGTAHDDVDQNLFKVVDNGTEGHILQIGKAFNQPISIALLLDASISMTYEMPKAMRAATTFVKSTLKDGDRCAVYSVKSSPRREAGLTTDRAAIENVVKSIQAEG